MTRPAPSTRRLVDVQDQFSPQSALNPREFKNRLKEIKEPREDHVSSGTKSHVLQGVTWEGMAKVKLVLAWARSTGEAKVANFT